MDRKIETHEPLKATISPLANVNSTATIGADVVICDYAKIDAGVVICAGSFIGRNVCIDLGAVISRNCVILEGTHIGARAAIGESSVIGRHMYIDAYSRIRDRCVMMLQASGAEDPYSYVDNRDIESESSHDLPIPEERDEDYYEI